MKLVFQIIEAAARICSLLLVGALFKASLDVNQHSMALALVIVFLLLLKFDDIDSLIFKWGKGSKSIEVKDDKKS
jgi:hypothetical protein